MTKFARYSAHHKKKQAQRKIIRKLPLSINRVNIFLLSVFFNRRTSLLDPNKFDGGQRLCHSRFAESAG